MDVVVAGGNHYESRRETGDGHKITTQETGGQLVVKAGALELRFDKTSGFLTTVNQGGKIIPLGNGPRFIAYTHNAAGRSRTITYQRCRRDEHSHRLDEPPGWK